jgi:epimerase transport system membrane fusion protein
MNIMLHATMPAGAPAMSDHLEARRLVRTAWWVVLGALLPAALWLGFAPITTSVVAPGFVKVDLNRRPVQHREGGIVKQVLVRDGQRVRSGEPVLVLGDVGVQADRERLDYRSSVLRASVARLETEQLRAPGLRFADDLLAISAADPRVREALKKEQDLFAARRGTLVSELGLMQAQRERIEMECTALRSQITQMQVVLALRRKTLDLNRNLLNDGFISPTRIMQIEAETVDYAATLDQRASELARATQRLGDVELRMQASRNAYVQTASDQLKSVGAQLTEIEQEMRKTTDAAARQVVVAPADGEVIDLKFTSPGSVIRPGDPIADIVPSDATLMVEARIRPEDINNVRLAQHARLKFTALKYRNHAMVNGTVTYVSGDRLTDNRSGQSWYSALVTVDPASLHLSGDIALQAGMPAEVFLEGSTQTTLQYLMEPLTSTARKALRQM